MTTLQQLMDRLEENFLASYFNLRVGVAAIALVFPFILWFGGRWQGIPLQDSMSAYYHATSSEKSMRDFFVGILWALGVCLILYKGYGKKEDYALNMAGIFSVGVAIFPMEWNYSDQNFSVHGICAISLFLCMAFVCIFCQSETLREIADDAIRNRFRQRYLVIGVSMVLAPVAAFLLAVVFKRLQGYTYIAEVTAIWVFAIYWLVKTWELSLSKLESKETFTSVKARGSLKQ
jgi:hypothetical protein